MYSNCTQNMQIVEENVKLGWKVFPIHCIEEDGSCSCGKENCGEKDKEAGDKNKGKHPLTISGFKDATDDPKWLKQWWSGKYEIANIGMATGVVSGVSVLDVDEELGLKTLKELNASSPKRKRAITP